MRRRCTTLPPLVGLLPGLLGLLLGLLLVTAPPAAAKGKPQAPAPAPAPPPARLLGFSTQGAPAGPELDALVSSAGRAPDEVMWFVAWSLGSPFPAEDARRVAQRGAVPVITWEPWDPARGTDQPTYAMRQVAAGRHDAYVRSWARAAARYGGPVVIRFAHEMNGSWYPWSVGVNGNTGADHAAAWNRVRGMFRSAGATQVRFRWNPNVPYAGSTPMAAAWPGDAAVDEVALDGYNWGTLLPGSTWTSFADLVGPGLAELGALTGRRVHVGETASTEVGGDKAAWIRGMFATVASDPRIAGVTWFEHRKETDWRTVSSESAAAAFREGLATY